MSDKFATYGLHINGPGLGPTPDNVAHATNPLAVPIRSILILTDGDLRFTGRNGLEDTWPVTAGTQLDIQITHIHTDTTCTWKGSE